MYILCDGFVCSAPDRKGAGAEMQDKSMITLPWESLNRMEAGRDPVVGAVCGKGMDAGGNLWSVLSWEKGWKTQRRCGESFMQNRIRER